MNMECGFGNCRKKVVFHYCEEHGWAEELEKENTRLVRENELTTIWFLEATKKNKETCDNEIRSALAWAVEESNLIRADEELKTGKAFNLAIERMNKIYRKAFAAVLKDGKSAGVK